MPEATFNCRDHRVSRTRIPGVTFRPSRDPDGRELHVAAISPNSLDADVRAGYRHRLAARLGDLAATAGRQTTENAPRTASAALPLARRSAARHGVTRSRCDYVRLPSAKLFQAGRSEVPARAFALTVDLLLTQEPPHGLHIPARQFGGLLGGVAPARRLARRVRHPQIISNYRYLQRKIIVTNDCFMGH